MAMKKIKIVPVVFVVYKSKDGDWHGFCHPYDVTCEAKTMEEAERRLTNLVKLYEEGLNKYGNPEHLIIKELSDKEDRDFFTKIAWPKISEDIRKHVLRSYMDYASAAFSERKEFSTRDETRSLVSFSHHQLAV